jgi:hypothetical protein
MLEVNGAAPGNAELPDDAAAMGQWAVP